MSQKKSFSYLFIKSYSSSKTSHAIYHKGDIGYGI